MINKLFHQTSFFFNNRQIFHAMESSEHISSQTETRNQRAERYGDIDERMKLFNTAEAEANAVLTSPEEKSERAIQLATRILTRVKEARKYIAEGMSVSDALSIDRTYGQLMSIVNSPEETTATSTAEEEDTEKNTSTAPNAGSDFDELDALESEANAAYNQDTDLAEGGNMASADLEAAASAGQSQKSTLNIGNSSGPVDIPETETEQPTDTIATSMPESQPTRSVGLGQPVDTDGPVVMESTQSNKETSSKREIVDIKRLPQQVQEAYKAYSKNPNNPDSIIIGDDVYTFVATTSTLRGMSGEQSASIAKVRIYKENKTG